MKKGKIALIVIVGMAAMMLTISAVIACPTAHCLGTKDINGSENSYVIVPVDIIDAQNGPIVAVGFNISYDDSIIELVGIGNGKLTENWEYSNFGNHPCGISSIMIASPHYEIPNGASGSIVMLNFSVIGEAGETSRMNFSDIQLSDEYGNLVGTTIAKDATFSVDSEIEPIPEFASIAIPAIAVLGLFLFFNKRKIAKK